MMLVALDRARKRLGGGQISRERGHRDDVRAHSVTIAELPTPRIARPNHGRSPSPSAPAEDG
jgi:hypothetical protein